MLKQFTVSRWARSSSTSARCARPLAHLVVGEQAFAQLGPAVNSGRSIFLFGPSDNGKTAIAVEVGGHVIRIFDYVNHVLAQDESSTNRTHDPRWMRVQ